MQHKMTLLFFVKFIDTWHFGHHCVNFVPKVKVY